MENITLTRTRQAILFTIGYIIAVLASVSITVGLILLPTTLPDGGEYGSFFHQLRYILPAFMFGFFHTGIFAFPGYVASLFLAHRKNFHSLLFYLVAGVATAISAHALLYLVTGNMLQMNIFIFAASLPGGAAGAYAYFLWRKKMLSVWDC